MPHGKIQFHANWGMRPKKSGGKRRERVKEQKKRLIAAGLDPKKVAKMGVRETRMAWKKVHSDVQTHA